MNLCDLGVVAPERQRNRTLACDTMDDPSARPRIEPARRRRTQRSRPPRHDRGKDRAMQAFAPLRRRARAV